MNYVTEYKKISGLSQLNRCALSGLMVRNDRSLRLLAYEASSESDWSNLPHGQWGGIVYT